MRISIPYAITLSLACAWGIGLAAWSPTFAEEKNESIEPIPESVEQQASQDCPHCEQGQVHGYGTCPHCRGRGRIFAGRRRGGNGYGSDPLARRASFGYGWCAPGKVTLQRERVQYWKYYPNYWSGRGPGPATPYHPMVYTPTDTTQLGFYYQHAPSWYAQPWRTPGAAHPAYWHNRYCGHCPNRNPYGYQYQAIEAGNEDGEESGSESEEVIDVQPVEPEGGQDSQSFRGPEPTFVPNAPRLSTSPNESPEA